MDQLPRIAYTRADGGITIVVASPKSSIERVLGPLTYEEYEAHVWKRSIPEDAINPRYVDHDEVPTDRAFRNAWVDRDGITHCMDKCRAIHMDKIRSARDKKLKELDIETMRGIDVQAEKQILRDIPTTIDLSAADTPEDLKKIWPQQL